MAVITVNIDTETKKIELLGVSLEVHEAEQLVNSLRYAISELNNLNRESF